ncbi:TPA: hypothetical protein QDZ34_001096 [Stenotrophomonas maltophilia]|nr:hypothetical protein [Stenotrophomonas maltophilia]HDS1025465.1 hypothetical protein [Stenotrophomonas maltophilia]HDS1029138.1 hypothetical protein [Stenotrophomonas maltophilia]HDS1033770.1 hypothetical protein [Stenotrophomonas maltophilia]
MKRDPLIWGTISSEARNYKMFSEHNELVPDIASQEIVTRSLTALRAFFTEEGLLTKSIKDSNNQLIDMELRASDFTSEGLSLVRSKVSSWVDSKGAKKSPPDMTTLKNALEKIRSK